VSGRGRVEVSEPVRVLRSTQLKLIRTVAPLVGRGLGTRPPLRPAIG